MDICMGNLQIDLIRRFARMYAPSQVLADPSASDPLWLAVVFLGVLAIRAGFRVAGGHLGKRRRRRLQRAIR